jgi:hypothetical protein
VHIATAVVAARGAVTGVVELFDGFHTDALSDRFLFLCAKVAIKSIVYNDQIEPADPVISRQIMITFAD